MRNLGSTRRAGLRGGNRGRLAANARAAPVLLLRWDARDYDDAVPDAVISGDLTPDVGSDVTFQGSPTWTVNAIGGGLAFSTPSTGDGFDADWLSYVMDGSNKPCTVIMRAVRGSAAAMVWGGWGRSGSATQDFFEILSSAGGVAQARKDANLEATVTVTGNTALGFTANIIALMTDGYRCWLYVNKTLQATFPLSLNTLPVDVDRFRFGCSGRSTGNGGLASSLYQHVSVYDSMLTIEQLDAATDAITARDIPATPGAPIYFIGDSITRGDAGAGGMRLELFNYIQTETLAIDMQGAFSSGTFADNQHSAVNGVEIASIGARAALELGTGNAFPLVELVLVMAGTNNMNNVGYDNAATLLEYADMLEDIFAAASSTVATVRLAVTTLLPFEPGHPGDTNVPLFNAGLDAVFDAFDILHPSNTLLRWDANAAMGAYDPTYYVDEVHLNAAGFTRICQDPTNGLIQAVETCLTSIG